MNSKELLTENFDLSEDSLCINNTIKGHLDLFDGNFLIGFLIMRGVNKSVSPTPNQMCDFIPVIDYDILV